MSRHGEELLRKIFDRWQSKEDGGGVISIPITRKSALPYFQADRIDDKEALHAYLRLAEHGGCISLTWGHLNKAHLLERVTLLDGTKLAEYLELPVANEEATNARRELQAEVSGVQPWIVILLDEMVKLWKTGKQAWGLSVDQRQEARELLRALEAVCAGRQEGLDLRTFSAKFIGDSKAMERMQSRFARVWQQQFTGDDLEPRELYESLGLVKFPHPMLFKGPVVVTSGGTHFDCSTIRPFVGFPPQAVDSLHFPVVPAYVLTIENYPSYNRHVAEVEDQGLVLYTGGFPCSAKARLFSALDKALPATVTFYHWGDLDLGGLRVMARVQQCLRRPLQPHLMTLELLTGLGENSANMSRSKLEVLGEKHPRLIPLVQLLLLFDPPLWLEQEKVDPAVPG